jgi:hypothetical protein
VSKKRRKGASKRSIAARKGWITRRANAARAKRRAAALKGWRTRRENQRILASRGAPQGGAEGEEDYTEQPARPRESFGGGEQDGGLYGGEPGSGEPAWDDFDGWEYEDFDGLDADADDDGDTGGESAKT